MSPTVSLVLDLVLVGLLVATITYAIILNRQILRLRESRGEMAELIKGLNEAMEMADNGVRGMKRNAQETGEGLQRLIDRAGSLRDELQIIVESGNTLADRLSGSGASEGEPRPRPQSRPQIGRSVPSPSAREPSAREPGTREMATREMGGREMGGREMGGREAAGQSFGGFAANIRPLLDEAVAEARETLGPQRGRSNATEPGDGPTVRDGEEGLSRAERELLRAIENRR